MKEEIENIKYNTSTNKLEHFACRKKGFGGDSSVKEPFFYNLNTHLVEKLGYKASAFLLKLKSEFCNGTVYNVSNRKIARIVGCSPVLAKKNIDILISHNLVEIHGGNLSIRRVKGNCKLSDLKQSFTKIKLSKKLSFKEYKDKMALLMIQRKASQQRYKATRDGDSNKPMISKSEIQPHELAIGMRKMANYIGISASGLCSLVKRLKKQGLYVHQVKYKLGKVQGDINQDALTRYGYKTKYGNMYIHCGSVYSFSYNLDKACSLL